MIKVSYNKRFQIKMQNISVQDHVELPRDRLTADIIDN